MYVYTCIMYKIHVIILCITCSILHALYSYMFVCTYACAAHNYIHVYNHTIIKQKRISATECFKKNLSLHKFSAIQTLVP